MIAVAPVGPEGAPLPKGLAKKVAEADRKAAAWGAGRGAEPGVVHLALSAPGSEGAAIRRAASELGLSLGQYLVFLEARKAGFPLDPSAIRQKGLSRAIVDAGGSLSDLLREAASETDFASVFRAFGPPSREGSGGKERTDRKEPKGPSDRGHGGGKSKKGGGDDESGDVRGAPGAAEVGTSTAFAIG
ncbi:MAG: hypothetical protein IRZ11_08675 [Clostridia bacterium]|nr:hypothetical protein [Clostridia bacterium]